MPRRSPGRRAVVLFLAASVTAVAAGAAAFLAGGASSQEAVHVAGEVRLDDYQISAFDADPKTCVGREGSQEAGPEGPQEDIFGGAQVVVRDEAGVVIGKSALGTGARFEVGDRDHCAFSFAVDGLPERPFYQIEVGRQPARVFDLAEVRQASGPVVITFP